MKHTILWGCLSVCLGGQRGPRRRALLILPVPARPHSVGSVPPFPALRAAPPPPSPGGRAGAALPSFTLPRVSEASVLDLLKEREERLLLRVCVHLQTHSSGQFFYIVTCFVVQA